MTFSVCANSTGTVVGAFDYGCYAFDHWADTGSTNRFRSFSIPGNTTFTAVYRDTCQQPSGTSSISVNSLLLPGMTINGMYATLWQNGVMLESCFTACTFTVSGTGTYQVEVSDYASYTFNHWSDGTMTRVYTVNITSTGSSISLTAMYNSG